MCDNSASTWSDHESYKRIFNSEYKNKIDFELQKLIDNEYYLNSPEIFIQGIEYARKYIQKDFSKDSKDRTTDQNDRLF